MVQPKSGRLENRWACKRLVGSNPTPAARRRRTASTDRRRFARLQDLTPDAPTPRNVLRRQSASRVDRGAAHADFEVEVRAGGVAGRADEADGRTDADALPDAHV